MTNKKRGRQPLCQKLDAFVGKLIVVEGQRLELREERQCWRQTANLLRGPTAVREPRCERKHLGSQAPGRSNKRSCHFHTNMLVCTLTETMVPMSQLHFQQAGRQRHMSRRLLRSLVHGQCFAFFKTPVNKIWKRFTTAASANAVGKEQRTSKQGAYQEKKTRGIICVASSDASIWTPARSTKEGAQRACGGARVMDARS